MRIFWAFIVLGPLAMLSPTAVWAQALRDATIPFQQPRFNNFRAPPIRLQPIQRENIRPQPLQLTPIQRRAIPRQNIRPPQLQISPIPRDTIPRGNFTIQPLRIEPLPREAIRRDNIRPPSIAQAPLLVSPLVLTPIVRAPLPRTTIQFDSSILGFPSSPPVAAPTTGQRRRTSATSTIVKTPRSRKLANSDPSGQRQPTGRRSRKSLGW